MNSKLLIALPLLLAAGLSAQSYVTAPPGYVSTTSKGTWAVFTGHTFKNGRTQTIDPGLPKGTARNLYEVAWRTTRYATYSPFAGQGRSWKSYRLTLAHSDYNKATSVFAKNYVGSGTLVYSGATKMIAHTSGTPTQKWGDPLALKFSKPFAYNGKNDLLFDISASGGTLANGETRGSGRSYYLDGCHGLKDTAVKLLYPGSPDAPGSKYVPGPPVGGTSACSDSNNPGRDAYAFVNAMLYSDNWGNPLWNGKVQVRAFGYRGRRSGTHIGVLSAFGSDKGVTIPGSKCQKLHVNMNFPLLIATSTADRNGTSSRHVPFNAAAPYSNSYVGIAVYWQFAWEDSKTKQLGLSRASKVVLPAKPTGSSSCPPSMEVYRYLDGSTWRPSTNTSYGFVQNGGTFRNPIKRFRVR